GKLYSRTFIKKLFSKMNKAVVDFLIIQRSRNFRVEAGSDVLSMFTDNKLNFAYLKLFNNLNTFILKSGLSNKRFLSEYILGYTKFNYDYISNKIIKKEKFQSFLKTLDKAAIGLFNYFIVEFIALYFNSRFISYNSNTPFENTQIYKLYNFLNISGLSSLEFEGEEFHKIYGYLLNIYSDYDREEDYDKYRNLVIKIKNILDKNELEFHISRLISYCIIKLEGNSSTEKFSREIIDLYDIYLNEKLFRKDNQKYLSREVFRSIVLNTIKYNKTDWLLDFVQKSEQYLNPAEAENLMDYAYMYIYFHKGNYEKALMHANRIRHDYFMYKFDVRDMILRLFYELGYTEETLNQIKSFVQFVRAEKISGLEWKKRYISFASYLEKITLYKAGYRKRIDIGFIQNKIMKSDNIYYKEWLINKIDELKSLPSY
ncbi:MAG: hypothetical protein N2510_08690, partial [Ignavibacteria bacterium]|nr:hypothetical protein [Ignavibacteria bacterium]